MASASQVVLCRYRYDPLDRLAGIAPVGQADALRFYQKSRLATEIQGAAVRTIVQHEDLLLAQQQHLGKLTETSLLATDQQRSVLQLLDNTDSRSLVYTPYGHLPADSGLTSLLGFNGEHRDPMTGHYMLGNGYRAFNPVLMRFNSPDSLSPFGEGGINAYAYCEGDPVNFVDSTGQFSIATLVWMRRFIKNTRSQVRLKNLAIDSVLDAQSIGGIARLNARVESSQVSTSSRLVGNSPASSSTISKSTYQASADPGYQPLSNWRTAAQQRISWHKKDQLLSRSLPETPGLGKKRYQTMLTHKGDIGALSTDFLERLGLNSPRYLKRKAQFVDAHEKIGQYKENFFKKFKHHVTEVRKGN